MTSRTAYDRRYRQSLKGRACIKRYNHGAAARATRKRYRHKQDVREHYNLIRCSAYLALRLQENAI